MTKNSPPSILVVEDESLVRMMAVDMFEEAGFEVFEASSGESALALIKDHGALSALFTDIELANGIDGVFLARRARDAHPGMPIIVVSGRHVPAVDDLPEGARFIDKPYDPELIVGTMNEMLSRTDQER